MASERAKREVRKAMAVVADQEALEGILAEAMDQFGQETVNAVLPRLKELEEALLEVSNALELRMGRDEKDTEAGAAVRRGAAALKPEAFREGFGAEIAPGEVNGPVFMVVYEGPTVDFLTPLWETDGMAEGRWRFSTRGEAEKVLQYFAHGVNARRMYIVRSLDHYVYDEEQNKWVRVRAAVGER